MTRESFAEELQSAADKTAEMSGADLKALLRRAALMLRNANSGGMDLEPKIEETIDGLAAEMCLSKPELIRTIVTEWLIANAHLPVLPVNDHSTTDGSG